MALALTGAAVLLAYLLGSIPVGVLACRPLGLDPRSVGSGRTGGTNVYRTAGPWAALVTVVGDVAKGAIAVWLAGWLLQRYAPVAAPDWEPWAAALAAVAAIVGHNWSVFAGFRGGAGTTPNLGALVAVAGLPTALLVTILALVALIGSRIASVASLTASAAIFLAALWGAVTGRWPQAYLAYGLAQLAIVSWALRPNISRLRAGSERRISSRGSGNPAPSA